jgi:hypothetical protein
MQQRRAQRLVRGTSIAGYAAGFGVESIRGISTVAGAVKSLAVRSSPGKHGE